MTEPTDTAEPSGASGGYGQVLLRRACRKMGCEMVSSDHFVCTAIAWLRKTHINIRVEFRAPGLGGWHVEPLDEDGEWTEKEAGFGLDLASALARAVVNKR